MIRWRSIFPILHVPFPLFLSREYKKTARFLATRGLMVLFYLVRPARGEYPTRTINHQSLRFSPAGMQSDRSNTAATLISGKNGRTAPELIGLDTSANALFFAA